METEFKISVEDLSTKLGCIIERRKGNRMKITFKLNQKEAEGYSAFFNMIREIQQDKENFTDHDFAKAAFFLGLQAMERSIIEKIQQEAMEQNDAEIGDSIDIVEDNDENDSDGEQS